MFSRKKKLRKEFDALLVAQIKQSKEQLDYMQQLEDLADEFDLESTARKLIAESKYFYLFKEARIRKVQIK